ncbi:MAG TPA: crosslink repair DNA glycosylase YcaQ family protein [Polyangiales bacterium]|nr:crosslink repair DNA glycosylase YcaQ family protein [Polyangiales bacterium]
MPELTLSQLRRHAIARSLCNPTSLPLALERLGFVQADPIRAPARAQDLTLRPRVADYRAGDLERLYSTLGVEEDFFINYGFLPHSRYALMHPRKLPGGWDAAARRRARAVLEFVRERGSVHPREVEARFAHGSVRNAWGGTSNATTHLLDNLHYRGLLRVARRDRGVRVYAATEPPPSVRDPGERRLRLDRLIDLVAELYAPLPAASLGPLLSRLRHAVPQWRALIKPALQRAKARYSCTRCDGVDYYAPGTEPLTAAAALDDQRVWLLGPFDPLVWDRRRFELFWGWAYRFEAYTPVSKRKLGYYALPLLWREHIIGWANLTARDGQLDCQLGFVERRPRERVFSAALEAELERMRVFLAQY